jgi:hypothetical protein
MTDKGTPARWSRTQLSENIVNKALIAGVVCQPVQNVAVRMRADGIGVGWRVHVLHLLLSSDLDRRHRIRRAPLDGVNGVRHSIRRKVIVTSARDVIRGGHYQKRSTSSLLPDRSRRPGAFGALAY